MIVLPLSTSKTQHYINKAYASYIAAAGFAPLCVMQDIHTPEYIDEVVRTSTGVILPGGIDLDPIYYGEDNMASTGVEINKDAFERYIYNSALKAGKPVLGICRGFQLIVRELMLNSKRSNKYMTYFQHINSHAQTDITRDTPTHFVEYDPAILYNDHNSGLKRMAVNSMHHQAVVIDMEAYEKAVVAGKTDFIMAAYTGRGLKEKGFVVCEAFAITGRESRILGVQWHPEELMDVALLQSFFGKKGEGSSGKVQVQNTLATS